MHGPLLTTLSASESQIDPLLPGLFSSAVESHAIPEKYTSPDSVSYTYSLRNRLVP